MPLPIVYRTLAGRPAVWEIIHLGEIFIQREGKIIRGASSHISVDEEVVNGPDGESVESVKI